jgi:hypothetical protein
LLLRVIGIAWGLLQPDFCFAGRNLGRGAFLLCPGVPSPRASAIAVVLKPSGWDAVELELVAALALPSLPTMSQWNLAVGFDAAQRNLKAGLVGHVKQPLSARTSFRHDPPTALLHGDPFAQGWLPRVNGSPDPEYGQALVLNEPVNSSALIAVAKEEGGDLFGSSKNVISQWGFAGRLSHGVHFTPHTL